MASIKLKGDTSGEVTISAPSVAGTTTLELPATSSTLATQNSLGVRNLIINGDMRIAQRGTSVSGINTGSGYHALDRWHLQYNGTIAGTWTMSQDNDVPTGQGFANSLKMACTTAKATLDAGSLLQFSQRIEGQMVQHLCYGTSSAKTTTMSFWVKSNKTGTYATRMYSVDSTRQINSSFTINSADTWEKKTITFSGDTTSAFDNDNNNSLILTIYFVAGTNYTSGTDLTSWSSYVAADSAVTQTVNLADSTSNYINITGVQLEVGEVATEFEHRPYDMELQRCQRYYYKATVESSSDVYGVGGADGADDALIMFHFPTTMRSEPTSLETTGTASDYRMREVPDAGGNTCTSIPTLVNATVNSSWGFFYATGLLTSGKVVFGRASNSSSFLAWSAEL